MCGQFAVGVSRGALADRRRKAIAPSVSEKHRSPLPSGGVPGIGKPGGISNYDSIHRGEPGSTDGKKGTFEGKKVRGSPGTYSASSPS
ncbi:hypothetical protein [Phormidium nigroviride]